MKKLLLFLAIVILSSSFAIADTKVDLSEMSYDALIALQRQLTNEIISRPEWKEVSVPAGTWIVGTDIPEGTYSISAKKTSSVIIWRRRIDDFENNGLYYNHMVGSDSPCGKIILSKGMVIQLSREAIFAPPLSLGF